MGGLPATPGASFEAPIPPSAVAHLHQDLDVRFQLCSSPMNTYFRSFCSPFADTDALFGSLGSMCGFVAASGALECHPPCTEEGIGRSAAQVEHMLSVATGPLTVVFVSPNWVDPPCAGLVMLTQSVHKRVEFSAPRSAHAYVSGVHYLASTAVANNARNVTPMFDTRVFVLQNDAGAEACALTHEVVGRLKRAFGAA